MTSLNFEDAASKNNHTPHKSKSRVKGMISAVFAGFRDVTLDAVPDKPRFLEPKKTTDNNSEIPLLSKIKSCSEESTGSGDKNNGKKHEEKESSDSTPTYEKKSTYSGGNRKQQKFKGKPPPPLNVKASRNYISISNSQNVHIGHTFEQKILVTPETPAGKPVIKKTASVKALLQSSDPASRDHINIVSTHVGHTWTAVGRILGYTSGQLDQFEKLGHNQLKEVVYQMLLDWLQVNGSSATVGKLSKSLWSAREREAVQKLAEYIFPSDCKTDSGSDD